MPSTTTSTMPMRPHLNSSSSSSSSMRLRLLLTLTILTTSLGLSLSSFSQFHGTSLQSPFAAPNKPHPPQNRASLTMRKQKASDRRTRRMQMGGDQIVQELIRDSLRQTVTSSPMQQTGEWKQKKRRGIQSYKEKTGGRGRSRKRATLYNSLSSYHNKFLNMLTDEYNHEEQEVMGRIKRSLDDPLGLEIAGHAIYDLFPQRRGNLFSDEVYRLVKAHDATTKFEDPEDETNGSRKLLPPNHKVSNNDVILLTFQPHGSGDFFNANNLPASTTAISVEGRVISTGPTYIDIALSGGAFEAAFGPAPNNVGTAGPGDSRMRLRLDRFFSNVPYTRMVEAVAQISSIPERTKPTSELTPEDENKGGKKDAEENPQANISMDDVFKEVIISTHAFTDPDSQLFHEIEACDLQLLSRKIAKPPMPTSLKLANQALTYMQKNPNQLFNPMNGPQLASIGAALTRKLTMIQGPPGTGKTTVASAIGFGFTHQCRSISPNSKVLACAFSNVGADNLAESMLKLGLRVVRIGKPSGVSENLWDFTLDSFIDKDPEAQKALQNAARATAQLTKMQSQRKGKKVGNAPSERAIQDIATAAVKSSIQACNTAAAKALREADVIVTTSTGAADPRLMAACGIQSSMDDVREEEKKQRGTGSIRERLDAPDGLPPLSLPFVIVDEACQSVEPATLIPLTASNSCQSLVLLGDPCQLPAVVKSDPQSLLSISLMERLAATLPQPSINMRNGGSDEDSSYLSSLPTKQAQSLLRYKQGGTQVAYKKRFAGSLLLSTQYRMHPSIAAFSSAVFYEGLLSTPCLLSSHRPFPKGLRSLMPHEDSGLAVRMINVGGRCHERRGEANKFSSTAFGSRATIPGQESTTYINQAEADRVVNLLKDVLRQNNVNDPFSPKSIGVITPYSGQVQLIKSMVAGDPEVMELVRVANSSIEVKSVDGYQGRERDIIIFSTVRSNRNNSVGFLSDWRRLNVALTRARIGLFVVGDLDTLSSGDMHWAAFAKWCQSAQCVL
ncbi:unnamed protein product [Cylindrotheca closterium]|uniref:AAA+ ATPase domain-containing protein n=1 Tax=Cylindrotheca closterium TaxID=2856 RepID=A0AAD2FVR9_9STRA|nr:unnamed protein product [Cylindrotheca closterium]